MATLNIPDELYAKLEQLAATENRSIGEQVVNLLEGSLKSKAPHLHSESSKSLAEMLPETRRRREALVEEGWPDQTEILADIRSRRRADPAEVGLPDSTMLIREDRDS